MIWNGWWLVAQAYFARFLSPIFSRFAADITAGLAEGTAEGIEQTIILFTVGGWLLLIALAVAMIVLVGRALKRFRRVPA